MSTEKDIPSEMANSSSQSPSVVSSADSESAVGWAPRAINRKDGCSINLVPNEIDKNGSQSEAVLQATQDDYSLHSELEAPITADCSRMLDTMTSEGKPEEINSEKEAARIQTHPPERPGREIARQFFDNFMTPGLWQRLTSEEEKRLAHFETSYRADCRTYFERLRIASEGDDPHASCHVAASMQKVEDWISKNREETSLGFRELLEMFGPIEPGENKDVNTAADSGESKRLLEILCHQNMDAEMERLKAQEEKSLAYLELWRRRLD